MTRSWRHVSALLLFLTLIAAACSSSPTEVVVGDDTAGVDDVADSDDAMEDEPVDDTDSGSAVAEDSAPVAVAVDPYDVMLADLVEARARWESTGIDEYAMTVGTTTAGGTRFLVSDTNGALGIGETWGQGYDEYSSVDSFFEAFEIFLTRGDPEVAAQLEWTAMAFDGATGRPLSVRWQQNDYVDDEASQVELVDFTVTFTNFRTLDAYPEQCSTFGRDVEMASSDEPVERTRGWILSALAECDYATLSYAAYSSAQPLQTSLGGSGVELLWEAEARGEPLMTTLFDLLLAEPGATEGYYLWPAEAADSDSEYIDWRVTIDEDGNWLYFLAGD